MNKPFFDLPVFLKNWRFSLPPEKNGNGTWITATGRERHLAVSGGLSALTADMDKRKL